MMTRFELALALLGDGANLDAPVYLKGLGMPTREFSIECMEDALMITAECQEAPAEPVQPEAPAAEAVQQATQGPAAPVHEAAVPFGAQAVSEAPSEDPEPAVHYFELEYEDGSMVCILGRRKPGFKEARMFVAKYAGDAGDKFIAAIREIPSEQAHAEYNMEGEENFPVFE